MAEEKRFAVLIDADNIAPKYINSILNEISNKGTITYKRVYCDWTGNGVSGWKKVLLKHSLTPIQQYSYTYGKNATDSAMIIDAMDILYGGEVDGFALCSSDSDFTRLAARLREAGKMVVGLGESKTPAPFCAACNEFKFLDRIIDDEDDDKEESKEEKITKQPQKKNAEKNTGKNETKTKKDKDDETSITPIDVIAASLKDIILTNGNEGNGIDMGELGSRLQKRYPDFDTRNYGYSKFSIFLKKFDFLTMEHIGTSINVMMNAPTADDSLESRIIEMVRSHERGINLGTLNSDIKNEFPDFTPKEYGFYKFEQYIRSIDALDVRNITPINKRVFIRTNTDKEQL